MSDDRNIELDEAAQALFAELGGVDYRPTMKHNLIKGASSLAEALGEEERQMDEWRIQLVEFAQHLSIALGGFRMPGVVSGLDDSIDAFLEVTRKLSTMPGGDGKLLLRYRGMGLFGEGKASDRYDYVIGFGALEFDLPAVKTLAKRRGLSMSHLPGRMTRSLEILALLNVNTINFQIGAWKNEDAQRAAVCLKALRRYFEALGTGDLNSPDQSGPPKVVLDEKSQPNPNLTMLAALNRLNRSALQGLVDKVAGLMNQPAAAAALEQYAGVYEALFAFKNIREKLVKPPIEVNNVRWLIVGKNQGLASKEEIRVARKVMEKLGAAPRVAAKVVDSIYGKDFGRLNACDLDGRLSEVSSFLDRLDTDDSDRCMVDEVLLNLEERLDDVSDDVLEKLNLDFDKGGPGDDIDLESLDIEVSDSRIVDDDDGMPGATAFTGPGEVGAVLEKIDRGSPVVGLEEVGFKAIVNPETDAGWSLASSERPDNVLEGLTARCATPTAKPLNARLYELAAFFKHRSNTKKKIKRMLRQPIDFDAQDYKVIAKDFDVSVQSAEELLGLLRRCFDRDGRFIRTAFEKSIPRFTIYEKKVFEFLWHYLKEIMQREDRVAFLNALQLLIAKMNQPRKALGVLLNDFGRPADAVTYSDRNALMLANILLRKYNKELRNDVEITPEEVLLVRDGLDRDVIKFAVAWVEHEQERFFEKIRAIHKNLKDSMAGTPPPGEKLMPARYLSTLEREVYIFLSLVGGATGHAILRSFVKEYGNPNSEIYALDKSPHGIKTNIQLLQVAIRGLARFQDAEDARLFENIRQREGEFIALGKDPGYHELVRRVMKWT
jgi:hypothetical protein